MILAIDTSCDDTSVAVVTQKGEVLSNVISSQITLHAPFGGVVPELACRHHVEYIDAIAEEALQKAGCTLNDITAVAPTVSPGLLPALLVGYSFAKGLSASRAIPLIPQHHMEGHLLSPFIGKTETPENSIGLIVSGGHTQLYALHQPMQYELLGETLDDSAGEAFDKVAKMLSLPYPGGPEIERKAEEGNGLAISFPRPMVKDKGLSFSFSGLKTAVMIYLHKQKAEAEENIPDICASFQMAVRDVLIKKAERGLKQTGFKSLSVCGGVSCNNFLRQEFKEYFSAKGISLHFAKKEYCTDNAAMIGFAASFYLRSGRCIPQAQLQALDCNPNLSLSDFHELWHTKYNH